MKRCAARELVADVTLDPIAALVCFDPCEIGRIRPSFPIIKPQNVCVVGRNDADLQIDDVADWKAKLAKIVSWVLPRYFQRAGPCAHNVSDFQPNKVRVGDARKTHAVHCENRTLHLHRIWECRR
jgi:hypothetical protein